MKIIAILLIISSLTKFYVTSTKLEVKDLANDIPISFDILDQVVKGIITFDGLICLLSGIFILCL